MSVGHLCKKLGLASKLLLDHDLIVEVITDSFEFDRNVKRASPDEAASNALSALLVVAGERHDEFEGIDLNAVHTALADYFCEHSTSQRNVSAGLFR